MSAFQDAPKPRIVRFIRGFTNFSVDPYYDQLSLVMMRVVDDTGYLNGFIVLNKAHLVLHV